METIFSNISVQDKFALDPLVDKIIRPVRSGEIDNYPRTNFTHGYTNLTMLTAEEWPG